ncbi:hypothetical protein D3C87_1822410 [compost metagenome]
MDFQVGAYPSEITTQARLVNHYLTTREDKSSAFGTGTQQDRTHTGSQSHTDRAYRRLDHFHDIMNNHSAGHHTTRAVDKEIDLFARLVRIQ